MKNYFMTLGLIILSTLLIINEVYCQENTDNQIFIAQSGISFSLNKQNYYLEKKYPEEMEFEKQTWFTDSSSLSDISFTINFEKNRIQSDGDISKLMAAIREVQISPSLKNAGVKINIEIPESIRNKMDYCEGHSIPSQKKSKSLQYGCRKGNDLIFIVVDYNSWVTEKEFKDVEDFLNSFT